MDRGERVQGIGKWREVGFQGELEVLNVLHRVFGIMVERLVVQAVVLFGVEDAPACRGKERYQDKEGGEESLLHTPVIGNAQSIFQISSWIAASGLSPGMIDIAMPLGRNLSMAER